MEHGQLEHLAQLLDLLLVAANVVVRDVGLLLDSHHRDGWVNLGRQWDLDLILVAVDADAHALFDVGGRHALPEPHDKLGELLDIDHVLGVIGVRVDDLRAARDLQRVLLLHHLLVGDKVPLRRRRKPCVRLLDADHLLDAGVELLDVVLHRANRLVVRPEPVSLEQRDVALVERAELLVLVRLLGVVVAVLLLRRHGARADATLRLVMTRIINESERKRQKKAHYRVTTSARIANNGRP